MKKAVMVATLCTMFFSVLAQDLNYREWMFTDTDVDSVAIFKSWLGVGDIKNWDEYFKNPWSYTQLVEVKPYNGEVFFDIEKEGMYCIVGGSSRHDLTTKHTYVVIDKEYIRISKEQGWVKEIGGKLSSKPYPLRFGRDKNVFVTGDSALEVFSQSEL